ncbi:MAG: extracellular solute-binding protein [Anaerolineales bacterium]|nr:extracellular solute-binding protein [Anaerolineales bacterium]MDW8161396.1 extracellular solute-binding protein [Anaerolineales bacterium]
MEVQRPPTPSPSPSADVRATITPFSPPPRELRRSLRIWLPEQLDPNRDPLAARLFQHRLQAFYEQFPNLPIEVRIKANAGIGGMFEALTAASAAAPLALPDLVLLPRSFVAPLARQGVLHPLDEYTQLAEEPGWYPYAQQLATVESTLFGIPFLGDVLLLAYPQKLAGELPLEWEDWLRSRYTLGFAAADPKAVVLLALYLQAGGTIYDAQGRLMLDEDILTKVLEQLSYAHRQGKLPFWVVQAEDDQLVSQNLLEGKIDSGFVWGSTYLKNHLEEWHAVAGFLANKTTVTLAEGWLWASTSPVPDQIGISFQLARFLSEAEFISAYAQAIGYLPVVPEAFATWQESERAKELDTLSRLAQIVPPSSLMDPLGAVLRNALSVVIRDRVPAPQAAKDAVTALTEP